MKCPLCNQELELFILFSQPPNPKHYFCKNKECESKGKWWVQNKESEAVAKVE